MVLLDVGRFRALWHQHNATDYVHNWIIGGNIRVPLILFMLSTLLLALSARLLAGRGRNAFSLVMFSLLLAPILLLFAGVHRQVNVDFNAALETHKAVMNQLFALAPHVADGTNIIVTLPMPEPLPLGPKPIASGVWGSSSELTMMYRRNVQGSFRWGTPEDLKFVPEGVRLPGRGTPIPYDHVLLFHFDGETLHPVTQLPQNALAEVGPQELCPGCIKPGPGRANCLRFLLE